VGKNLSSPSPSDVDDEHGDRSEVAELFEPSIQCIVDAVLARKKDLGDSVTHVVLVGGFSSSSWLFGEVKRKIEAVDGRLNVFRAEHHAYVCPTLLIRV